VDMRSVNGVWLLSISSITTDTRSVNGP